MISDIDQHCIERIRTIKEQLGDKLVILGHYYQRKEILSVSDYMGDSFELARHAAQVDTAQYIVFCGVHFMAESAAILSKPNQIVQLPDLAAGCPMADMAKLSDVEIAWNTVTGHIDPKDIVPVTYMNSTAAIKAFCGKHGGAVCTSSNAKILFEWARNQGKKIFFLPDEHLGRNTARELGITPDSLIMWDPDRPDQFDSGEVPACSVILWKGYCHVHTFFQLDHVKYIRKKFPDAVIIAHPECPEEVIEMVDYSGSTGFIEKYVREAQAGATIAIATEINMIDRLAQQYSDKKIVAVARSLCPNMFKINLPKLMETLEKPGEYNVVDVPDDVKADAHAALSTMLKVVSNAQ